MPCNNPVTTFKCVRGTAGRGADKKLYVLAACDNGRVHVYRLKFATSGVRAKRVTTLQVCHAVPRRLPVRRCLPVDAAKKRHIRLAAIDTKIEPQTTGQIFRMGVNAIIGNDHALTFIGKLLCAWPIDNVVHMTHFLVSPN